MEVSCPGCQRHFVVQDEKLPPNAVITLTCPGCRGKIPVDTTGLTGNGAVSPAGADDPVIEFFEEGAKKALVCMPAGAARETTLRVLGELDYKTSTADDLRALYAKVRYNQYDIVVVNDDVGGEATGENPVLRYLERLPMSIRRNVFVLLISSRLRTMDSLTAFSLSVNAVINQDAVGNARDILYKCLVQHERFYRTFRDRLKAERRV